MKLLKNPIILALDVDDRDTAKKIVGEVGELVGAIKLGPRLIYRYGSDFVKEISQKSAVFVDNKYFDIPSTMVSAVKASFEAGATLVTVHALAGSEALKELANLETELNKIRPFRILAVTILTSWDQNSYSASLQPWTVSQHVTSLASEVDACGLKGLVCSGHELELLKNYTDIFKVVPGIRLSTDTKALHDQKRVMSPREALTAGASALVIGRAILESNQPQKVISEILESCAL
jgi:orotidine-5'-phosphate decarboxylase